MPSQHTADRLYAFAKSRNLLPVPLEVLPYPVSPLFAQPLTFGKMRERTAQLNPGLLTSIHLAIPISGAAVGTEHFTRLIDALHKRSARFIFHVVSKSAPFTQTFLHQMMERPFVRLRVSALDREIVNQYEQLYRDEVISLEITKPSEQAFKALLTPRQVGGSVLLFSSPVGRQEYDNLDFLARHQLTPSISVERRLFQMASQAATGFLRQDVSIRRQARQWRGLKLPSDPIEAAQFIWWCMREGVFAAMADASDSPKEQPNIEIRSDGVRLFWERAASLIDQTATE